MKKKLALLAFSAGLSLLLAELALRLLSAGNSNDYYYVWPPGYERSFRPGPGVMQGVEGEAHFRANRFGLRGDPKPSGDAVRMIAVGGSTTECLYLDHGETWPALVQAELSSRLKKPVWLGNAGRSGRNTRAHVAQVKELLEQHDDLDALVLLLGMNDLSLRLGRDTEYKPTPTDPDKPTAKVLQRAFSAGPHRAPTGIRLLNLVKKSAVNFAENSAAQDQAGRVYVRWRENRRSAGKLLNEPASLDTALTEYRTNVLAIVRLAKAKGVPVVFLTQPSLWRADLSEEERGLLWMGGVGKFLDRPGSTYYEASVLERMLNEYNQALLRVCVEEKLSCLDLAKRVPKTTAAFYDDVHFNEAGARVVAKAVGEHLVGMLAP